MQQKKIPLRKCTGCCEMKPKKELVRIVRSPEGEIHLDSTGKMNGRGAYICPDLQCLQKAKKGRRLEKAFECSVPAEIYDRLETELNG
ncbi:MAG: YlxR family protein [Clostridia bacterium]|nr:YlxR family protein [Clostridia bacterium]MBR2413433.1 YlxR family protein [Clostridia bacterium]